MPGGAGDRAGAGSIGPKPPFPDVVYASSVRLPAAVTCNVTLWAACIGGAMQRDEYVEAIERIHRHGHEGLWSLPGAPVLTHFARDTDSHRRVW